MSWKDNLTLKTISANLSDVHHLYTTFVDSIYKYKKAIDADYKFNSGEGKSKVSPRSIKTLHNYAYAALSEGLLSDYDVVDVSPRGHSDKASADAQRLLLNYQINEEMEFDSVVDKASRYFEDYGSFYLKLSWNYKERKVKTTDYEVSTLPEGVSQEQLQQLDEQGLLTEDGKVKVYKEVTKVVGDHPVLAIKKHNQIILGASTDGSNDMNSLEFIADKYYSTISNLRATKKYENLDNIYARHTESDYDVNALPDADFELEFNAMMSEADTDSTVDRDKVPETKVVVVTEYWTKVDTTGRGDMRTVVVTFVCGTIISKEFSPFGEDVGYPFTRGMYSPCLDDSLYDGIPDTLELEEDQKVIGAVSRGLIDILGATANGQVGIAQGFVDPAEERKLQTGKHYKFNPTGDPARSIIHTKYPDLPQGGLQMLDMMNKSMEATSGKKMFREGLNSASYGDVAAGIQATTNATTQRTMSSIRRFNKPFVDIIKKLAQLNKEFITDDKIVALSDKSFTTIRNSDLQTDVNIKISISTPELDEKKAQKFAFMVQTFGDSVDHNTKLIMLADIATLNKRPDLAEALKNVPEPQPSKEELEIHQLNVELLKARIANEKAKAYENTTDGTLNEAKASTENAKASVLMSTKDNQDLDFIHRKGGIDEDRANTASDRDHVRSLESDIMSGIIKSNKGDEPDVVNRKVPKRMNDADIPVIDTPKESLQPSDLK